MQKNSGRTFIQIISSVFLNGYAAGFARGKIFKGKTKFVCIPVLNCYSCPGALGSCPIGSLQSISSGKKHFSFYAFGLIALFGLIFGRLLCGFICPFGFLQDLLFKTHTRKLQIKDSIDKKLRYIKYIVLFAFVLILPAIVRDEFGIGRTFFCTYVCPAGTLEAGIPLLAAVPGLRNAIGFLFSWKALLLACTIFFSIKISRVFCKYICPLGAFYGFFSKISLFQLELDKEKCINCKRCENNCPMGVKCLTDINTSECIRCGKCKDVCPSKAIKSKFAG